MKNLKKSLKRILLFGFLAWLIPFIVGVAAYPIKEWKAAFFETIMAVVLVLTGVVLAHQYFKKTERLSLKDGIVTGIIWLGMAIIIDLFFFSWGPMRMTVLDYLFDIGLEYLIYPTTTGGLALMAKKQRALVPPPPPPPQP